MQAAVRQTRRLTGFTLMLALAATLLCCFALLTGAERAEAAGPVERSMNKLQQRHQISRHRARWALRVYKKARIVNARLHRPIRGKSKRARAKRRAIAPRRAPMRWQVALVSRMAARGNLTHDRVAPLFTTLNNNARWFRHNGPAVTGSDRRFGNSRIIFQYFDGIGWQWHPLSNFAKLNAIWTVDTPPSRRAQRSYARELIRWGVRRNSALTWEYYFDFSGSRAPWVSVISQGTAAQSLARVAYRMHNRSMMRAARLATRSFRQTPTRGIKLRRDGGYHFLAYSGSPRLIILNQFLQGLVGLRAYARISGDRSARALYMKGLAAARTEVPLFDTGSWSLYSLDGVKDSLHYHLLTISFLGKLCGYTREAVFCDTRDRFKSYVN